MNLRLSLLALALLGGSTHFAEAQMSTLNTLGRHCGWGFSDGYHANRLREAGCSGCATCSGAVQSMPAYPPLTAPVQHSHIHHTVPGQPVAQTGNTWQQLFASQPPPSWQPRPATTQAYPAVAPQAPTMMPYGAAPRQFAPPAMAPYNTGVPRPVIVQPQPIRTPQPSYRPVSFW